MCFYICVFVNMCLSQSIHPLLETENVWLCVLSRNWVRVRELWLCVGVCVLLCLVVFVVVCVCCLCVCVCVCVCVLFGVGGGDDVQLTKAVLLNSSVGLA